MKTRAAVILLTLGIGGLLVSGCSVIQSLLYGGSASGSAAAVPATCALTPADMEGPYYIPGAPVKDSLYPPGAPGTPLVISGVVYAADCTPLAGAEVDAWQADASGEYDFSEQFIGRGKVLTDENGRYEFRTILPGRYEPRPPHIHVKVRHPQAVELTTQIYFEGNDNTGQRGVVITAVQEGGALRGTFDVVLALRD